MTNKIRYDRPLLFMLGTLILLILWQILLPGYIFGLDQIVTPFNVPIFFSDGFYNRLPQYLIQSLLYFVLPGWLAQKVVIVGLFAGLAYLPYRFIPIENNRARLWAAIFFLINPFVYTRFLAGQLSVLFSYACLPPFIYYLVRFWRDGQPKDIWLTFLWLLIIGMFSLHLLIMAILVLLGVSLINIVRRPRKLKTTLKPYLLAGTIFLLVSSYWIAPYLLNGSKGQINNISTEHSTAFQTTADPHLGTTLNVLALNGFWAEDDPWADYFIWPKDHFWSWSSILLLLLVLMAIGLRRALTEPTHRTYALTLLIIATGALVFSCGVAESPFRPINQWLFEHLGFWRGFRDTTKWSAFIALAYAYFSAVGVTQISNYAKKFGGDWPARTATTLLILPLAFTYPMLGGFSRQIQPTWYPSSWLEVRPIIDELPTDAKIIALPWHQYMSLPFNRYQISANPTRLFFGDRIVQSENMELANITGLQPGSLTEKVDWLLTQNSLPPETISSELQLLGINYAVVLNELLPYDRRPYPILTVPDLIPLYSSHEISLYELPRP